MGMRELRTELEPVTADGIETVHAAADGEPPLPATLRSTCRVCDRPIRTMIFRGTGACSHQCGRVLKAGTLYRRVQQ